MLEKGVYYFWLARTYPWGDIGRSITQWVFVGLNQKICAPGSKAFATRISNIESQPWGYTCRSYPNFRKGPLKGPLIDDQMDLVREDVKQQAQLHELATHLRPLERADYWSDELHEFLEKYLEIEVLVYHEGLKRKCEWLLTFIRENDINLHEEGVRFNVERYGRGRDTRIVVRFTKEFKNPATEWVMRRLSIKPKPKGRAGRRIQRPDVVLYYPVFKELLPEIHRFVQYMGISQAIEKRWGGYP